MLLKIFIEKSAVFLPNFSAPDVTQIWLVQAAKILREMPKFCRVYAVKRAVFLHNAGKKTA